MNRSTSKRGIVSVGICLVFLLTTMLVAGQQKTTLTALEKKVIDFLVSDWGNDYSVTSVDIAMDAVGVKQSEEARFRIGNHIKAHPELHEVIRRWGWVTLVLTPDEKLIARALINAEHDGKPQPTISEIAKAVGVADAQVDRGLSMLERYEIVQRAATKGAGYKVVPRYIKWEPRLDFIFHTVSLDSGRQFNTN